MFIYNIVLHKIEEKLILTRLLMVEKIELL